MGAKEPEPAPEGTRPMLISMREMETLGLKTGSGLRETVEFKVLTRQEVLDQIAQVGFMSPFHEFRAEIAKVAAGDDILIVADPNETYGENWLLCLTRRAFDAQMELIKRREQDRLDALAAQEKEADAAADANDMSKIVYEDKPMLSRPWTSATARESHDDVEALSVKLSRPLVTRITMSVTKMSDELNADYKFSDRDADQCFVEWRQHKDPNYELTRMEQDVGLQGTPPLVDGTTQTSWFRSVNSALQYEPIVMEPAERRTEMDSDKVQAFLARVLPRVERALQQNETLDVFLDPFAHLLEEEDASLGNKNNENAMRELRSFTDLVYSKNKTLPAIDWHPRRHGVIAVAAAANASFARRLDLLDTVDSSFILIWNFVDLIHPQIMLESPQDVLSMRFNPAAPHLVAAGLYNGQVLVWDFSKAEHLLSKMKTTKTTSGSGGAGAGTAAGSSAAASSSSKGGRGEDDAHKQVPPVKPLYVSYIDVSHRRPVADLQWLPAGVEVNSRGHVVASTGADAGAVNQFVTIAADGQVSFWDLRFKDPKYRGMTRAKVDKTGTAAASSKDGAAAPDVHFVPIYSISLAKIDSPGELSLQTLWLEKTREESGAGGGEGGSGGVLPLTSKFYCGTEEGEFVYADWRPHAPAKGGGNKGDDGGARGGDEGVEYVQWLCRDHSRPILGLCASPFFPSIFLTASESHFHLWNVSQQFEAGDNANPSAASNGPIFVSPLTPSAITCVAFSPSRPGVVFLGKADGMLEVWDFLDQSHRSSLSIGVTACALTSIEFRPQLVTSNNPSGNNAASASAASGAAAGGGGAGAGRAKVADAGAGARSRVGPGAPAGGGGIGTGPTNIKQQLVAVGDQIGNLHILEVPRTLSRPTSGERAAMEAYFKRESERMKAARAASKTSSSGIEGGAPSLRQGRGEDGVVPANNLSSLGSKEADSTRAGPVGADDEGFKQMETDFCRDMGLETARSA
ncbi:WD repeat-containing protein 63 [Phytophthora pseudosyringae]|uniref:WD repeat-containing protein 63 n=1 Tax=Phytophthora pseudosyringae TaxID=221518 RepID=A0A8T1VXY7_9STRA|nr:WD repeat-containing protein 63 [Phytophthora pseudosyringae]